MKLLAPLTVAVLTLCAFTSTAGAQTLEDSYNAGATPFAGVFGGGVNTYGIIYTPSSTYNLTSVDTKFSSASGQTITLQVFSGGSPSFGGTLLGSNTFTAGNNVFSGTTVAPIRLTLGQTYFIGFSGVALVGVNFTGDNGATSPGPAYLGTNYDIGPFVGPDSQIILELFGVPAATTFAQTPGLTPNETAIAANIDANSVNVGPKLTNVITALQNVSPGTIPHALDELSPQKFGQFTSETAFNNASFATEQMDNYLASKRTGPSGTFIGGNGGIDSTGLTVNDPSYDPNLAMVHSRLMAWNAGPVNDTISDVSDTVLGGVDMKDMKSMKTVQPPSDPWNFFVQGNVILAQGFSQADVPHFDDNTASVTLGADYRITPNFLIGLTAGYGHTDATLDTDGSSATVDSYSPGFYASYANKGWYANLNGNYSHNAYTQSRVIGFLGQTATSAPEGNQGTANLDGGYEFHHGGFTYGPLIGVQYTHLSLDGYNEGGSDADLTVSSQDSDSLRSRLGGRVSFTCNHCGMAITPHLDASWQHEFMDQSRGINSQFSDSLGSFDVRTTNPSRDSALVDAGIDAAINRTVTLFANYTVEVGQDNYFGHSIEGGVKIGF